MQDEERRDKTESVRLKPDEKTWLHKKGVGFSDYVHQSIQRDKDNEKGAGKSNKLKYYSNILFLILFGIFFLAFSLTISSFIGQLIIASIGIFMMLYGFGHLYLEVKKHGGQLFNRGKH